MALTYYLLLNKGGGTFRLKLNQGGDLLLESILGLQSPFTVFGNEVGVGGGVLMSYPDYAFGTQPLAPSQIVVTEYITATNSLTSAQADGAVSASAPVSFPYAESHTSVGIQASDQYNEFEGPPTNTFLFSP